MSGPPDDSVRSGEPFRAIVSSLAQDVTCSGFLPTFSLPYRTKMGIVGAGKDVWFVALGERFVRGRLYHGGEG